MTVSPLYIDPGTGSMLFSLFIGLATAAVFAGRALILKAKFILSGGKIKRDEKGRAPFVIYSDHKRYWNVFKPVCDEFERRGISLLYLTQSADDPVFAACGEDGGYKHIRAEFIGEGNKGFARLNMLKADIVLSTTPGLDVLQWKRSRDVKWYVHIPHSLDELGYYKMFALTFYDAILTTGKNQIDFQKKLEEQFEKARKKEYNIAGAPFMDAALERIKSLPAHTVDKDNPRVLLAPSWGAKSLLNIYGEQLLDALKATGFKVTVRPHPQSFTAEKERIESLMTAYPDFEWNRDNDNLAVLNRNDILITDFSGIIFEWALLFGKPLIFASTKFNPDTFDAAWVKEDLWSFGAAKRIGTELKTEQLQDLKSVILSSFNDTEKSSNIKLVQEECWAQAGKGAQNIADYMVAKQKELLEIH